ncbi:MAG: hypothetical protein MUF49_25455 [Oculatellaceae cyanobacterium Prado106]|jgi:hypothetical protein|nr:hypothetical protein [Oculatellaceae cyanobacterium Prado106]
MKSRWPLLTVLVVLAAIALGYALKVTFPTRAPLLSSTLTPLVQPASQSVDSYDVMGITVSPTEANQLLQTQEGQQLLAPENGAIAITQDLIDLGRDSFYRETFGNEYFFTNVMGVLGGPLNLWSMGRAIADLGGKATTNLQVPIDQDATIGGRLFKAGTKVDTGLDVLEKALIPLGMQTFKRGTQIQVGLTCALCHATLDKATGKIIEGAPNADLDTGLLQAMATNSAAMFRQTGVNPLSIPKGDRPYINAAGQTAVLPDAQPLEDAVDAQFLAWAPGNFDSTADNVNNPSQNPSSYTFDTWPYGWSGFASIGSFHGLSTLNNNVHATNSDPTTGGNISQDLLGIDKETYLGAILQNAADAKFRLPQGAKPSSFFETVDPTSGQPGMNRVIKMPGYPKGTIFMLDGLMAGTPGYPVGEEINAMSAYQNTLSPPPNTTPFSSESLQRGSQIFQSSCATCHTGRYFTNHDVIPEDEIKAQPSRAIALAKFPQIFVPPQTYPSNTPVPLPGDPNIIPVPTDITPQRVQDLAYAVGNPQGGYKVQNLIGLQVTAPYLHDGGVAASKTALKQTEDGSFTVVQPDQMGLAGTLMQHIEPDPEASLRVLVDRTLRQVAVAANRDHADLQAIHSDGSGHEYWVDAEAGFTPQDQTNLVQFLLSIDDDPEVLPMSNP